MSDNVTEELLAGRYALTTKLGQGGMGIVWRAEDRVLKREVAIKEVRFPAGLPEGQRDSIEKRVQREARTAAGLNHPNAVAVYDVLNEEGRAFIVMELVDAPTLAEVVEDEGPLLPRRAAEIGVELVSALSAAHAKGIVHRDVKPANVMVPSGGPIKLADFGIANVKGDPRLTASGMILGSPSYMSPEQAQEASSSEASDIWAVGATLYFAIEGKAPFERSGPIATLTAVTQAEPEFTERSGELRPILEAALRKDPEQRPSADDLRSMLKRVAGGQDAGEVPAAAPTLESTRTETRAEPAPAARPAPRRPRRGLSPLAIAALLLGVGALLLLLFLPDNDEPGRERASGGDRQEQGGEQDGNAVSLPEDWTTFTDDATGYSIAHPAEWEIVPGRGTAQSVDIVDPETNSYMRIDWTDSPGDSAVGAWEAQAEGFASSHDNYEEIRIEEVEFRGYDAAEWEYTYSSGDTTLHAINLGFVTGDYGFALNYQAPDDAWDGLRETFEQMQASFVAP